MRTGSDHGFHWLVSTRHIWKLAELVLQYHAGLRLCITALDGDTAHPNAMERARGWSSVGRAMVSPPLTAGVELPFDQYDEWYLVTQPEKVGSDLEVFVNYGGFTVVPPAVTYEDFDPTWEKGHLDYLVPIQERFWTQMKEVAPVSYIAMGDNDVLVSIDPKFIEAAAQEASSCGG